MRPPRTIRRIGQFMLAPLMLAGCPPSCVTTPPPPPPGTQPPGNPGPPPTNPPGPGTTLPPGPNPPVDTQFFADFATAGDFYDRFQIDVHFRDPASTNRTTTWPGDHNASCAGPTTTRTVSARNEADLFWWCAPNGPDTGHVMSSMGDIDGYTILSFAPNRAFADIDRVCWDVNLTDLGPRKWFQVLVVPESDYRAKGGQLDYISPVTQDVDETAHPMPSGSFMFQWWDHAFRLYNPSEVLVDFNTFSTTDKAKRYKHCMVDNGNGTITVSQERDGGTYTRTVAGSFPAQGRVIFQDDNYTPLKDGPIAGFTWHWDNIEIS